MRLVIREYLSMLKESRELDALLPDLLLAMGFDLLSRPGIGSRQWGVDLPAVGIDPKDQKYKLFLFTVKEGDITRSKWDNGKNAVRPSLNEILDSYLRNRVRPEHSTLPKKIILTTGGELKQDVEPDWVNYVNSHEGTHHKYGDIEFDFWGGDALTLFIERFLLDEYLFPESAQKNLRKTIALADQNEDEPRYFYEIIEDTLFKHEVSKERGKDASQQRRKALNVINLSLNIVFHWCKEADNLKPAFLCAERTILRTWDWIRKYELFDCKTTIEQFQHILFLYLDVANTYAIKLQPVCGVRDGFFGYGSADELEYPLRTFEVIGVLGSLGITYWYLSQMHQEQQARQDHLEQAASAVAKSLAVLIQNNPSALMPRYDGHSVDIALGLLTLTVGGYSELAAKWVRDLSARIIYAYQIGRNFPVASDSYNELIAMSVNQAPPKEKLMELSTLIPMLADWYSILGLAAEYRTFQNAVTEHLANTNLQLWFPDDETDNYLYICNAGYASGITVASIRLPPTLDKLKAQIIYLRDKHQAFKQLSCFVRGFVFLGLIASRHFRTPIIPGYWQYDADIPDTSDQDSKP